ncbi:hypothetical protein AX15_000310 [Amanita polypyramis BW_CC]|nr:hypothetical protein AX15_000310 [Amanita polypyramis BW_CC]
MDTPYMTSSPQDGTLPSHPQDQHVMPYGHRRANGLFPSIHNWITKKFSRHTRPSDANAHDILKSFSRRKDGNLSGRAHTMQAPIHHHEMTGTMSTPPTHTSPVLRPGSDYAKMGAGSSDHAEEQLSRQLTKLKELARRVNDLPWVGTERITVDYYPGRPMKRPQVQPRSLSHAPRHVRSWYSERSSLLPFTVVPEGNGQSPQSSLPHPAVPLPTADYGVDRSENDIERIYPKGYVPAAQQQDLAVKYPHNLVHNANTD